VARESAIKARTNALLQIRDVLITAPSELREHVEAAGGSRRRVTRAASLRPDLACVNEPLQAAKLSLRTLARRVKMLDEEIAEVDVHLGAWWPVARRRCSASWASEPNTRAALGHRGSELRSIAQ